MIYVLRAALAGVAAVYWRDIGRPLIKEDKNPIVCKNYIWYIDDTTLIQPAGAYVPRQLQYLQ